MTINIVTEASFLERQYLLSINSYKKKVILLEKLKNIENLSV